MTSTLARFGLATVAAFCALVIAACGKNDEADAAKILGVTVTANDRVEASQIFATRCTPCHGAMGTGDGPTSKGLTPQPRNFQDRSWQKSVDNEHITKIIRFGGLAVGKSPAMPPNPDLNEKGAVVAALTGRVRGFGN